MVLPLDMLVAIDAPATGGDVVDSVQAIGAPAAVAGGRGVGRGAGRDVGRRRGGVV
jgi:hypothetical protein